jgi:carbon storage regulator CsrA
MLVLTREIDQRVYIDTPAGRIEIVVLDVRTKYSARLGFEAPPEFQIYRDDAKERSPK